MVIQALERLSDHLSAFTGTSCPQRELFQLWFQQRTITAFCSRYTFPNCTDVAIYPFQGCSLEGRGSGENSLEPWTSSLNLLISAFRKDFSFWGVTLQRADMHQREVVRENIQGRLLALLPPSRAGLAIRITSNSGQATSSPMLTPVAQEVLGGQFLTTPGGTPMADGVNH